LGGLILIYFIRKNQFNPCHPRSIKKPIMKTSEIKFNITLDENKLPETITWKASDTGMDKEENCKAIMLAVWDPKTESTLKIDLWTKDMQVDEMKKFFHQTLLSMTDTLKRSISEDKMAADLKDFCEHFAEKLEILQKKP
jgi:gliding motility-associated protein GldC